MNEAKTIGIIGAGPVGLAAAAHVLERGMRPIVLEAGPEPAHAVRQWQHVQLFSPWEYNVDKAAERLLSSIGWNSPDPHVYPTGAELLERYLEPLAGKTILERRYPHLQSRHRRKPAWLRQGKDPGPRKGALRNSLPKRQGTGDATS